MVIKHYILKVIITITLSAIIGINNSYILPDILHDDLPIFITTTLFASFSSCLLFLVVIGFVNLGDFCVKKIRSKFKNNNIINFLTSDFERTASEEIEASYEYKYFILLGAIVVNYFGIYIPNLKYDNGSFFFIISAIVVGIVFKNTVDNFEEHSVNECLILIETEHHEWIVKNIKKLEEIFHKLAANTTLIINRFPSDVTRSELLKNLKVLKQNYKTIKDKIPNDTKYKAYVQDIEITVKNIKKMISDLEQPALIHLSKINHGLKQLTHAVDKPYDYFLENIDDIQTWSKKLTDGKIFQLNSLKNSFHEMFTLVETILGYCANDFVEEEEYLNLKKRLDYIEENNWRFFDFINVLEKRAIDEKS